MESRRDFLKKAAVAAAGLTIVPSKTIAGLGHKAPSDTMNIVGIGIGGKGHPNLVGHGSYSGPYSCHDRGHGLDNGEARILPKAAYPLRLREPFIDKTRR